MFQECRHIKPDGLRCHGAALRGKPYCFFHMNLRRTHGLNYAESRLSPLPPIEDTASILIAIGQVLKTLDDPFVDFRRASLKLRALQIAARLTAQREKARPEQLVRTLYNPSGDTIDFSAALEEGIDMLAPDKTVCEPPQDCRNCPTQATCDNYEEPEDEEQAIEEEEETEEENEDEEEQDIEEIEENDEEEPELNQNVQREIGKHKRVNDPFDITSPDNEAARIRDAMLLLNHP
jgi:hypothetical protein